MSSEHINPDKCIACTICQVQCPVAKVTPNFLGPRLIGPAYERFRLFDVAEEESLHYCANCKNCDIACPQGVAISTLNMQARCEYTTKNGGKLRDWVLSHGGFLADLFKYIPTWLKNFGMLNPVTRLFLDTIGISKKAPIPKFDKHFRLVYKKLKQPKLDKKVVYFPGCYVDDYDYSIGLDMIWIFNQAGYEVIVPEKFVCCGLPLVSNGFIKDAAKNAAKNVSVIKEYKEKGIPIVTGCPSCALMFKKDVPEMFPDVVFDDYKGGLLDAQEFLMGCVERGELSFKNKMPEKSIIYHSPCHLRAQGIGLPGLDLIEQLTGNKVINAQAGCCGISGSYGFKKDKYQIGLDVGKELFDTIKESKCEIVTTECGTCQTQIQHGTGQKAYHPVTVIRQMVENNK
ncbi:MAG: anaerobic glycerol-3-phosphate dehydrogenase subunit C [Candidatus Mucispirillum faecigallinarum]|nr:anaerobic glycerol-3-phosphate dehydrogenase subunit C [Candidatus Mucispirillum faecigallinarum]